MFISDTSKYKCPLLRSSDHLLPSRCLTSPHTYHTLAAGSCSSTPPPALALRITSGLCHVPANTSPQRMVASEFQRSSILLPFRCPHPQQSSRFCHNPELVHTESNTPLGVFTLTFSFSHSSAFMKTLSLQRLHFCPSPPPSLPPSQHSEEVRNSVPETRLSELVPNLCLL